MCDLDVFSGAEAVPCQLFGGLTGDLDVFSGAEAVPCQLLGGLTDFSVRDRQTDRQTDRRKPTRE